MILERLPNLLIAGAAHLTGVLSSGPGVALILVCGFLISFLGHGAWAVALSLAPFRALYARARAGVEGALGVFFAFAAFKLATSRS